MAHLGFLVLFMQHACLPSGDIAGLGWTHTLANDIYQDPPSTLNWVIRSPLVTSGYLC